MNSTRPKAAFLFPQSEYYDSSFVGAITNWVETYMYYSSSTLNWSIVASILRSPLQSNKAKLKSSYPAAFRFIERFFFSKREGIIWCLFTYIIYLRKTDIIVIENRPHYGAYLRRFGFKGKIVLHMHNDFLASYSSNYMDKLNNDIDLIFTVSKSIALNYKHHKALFNKTVVIPNAVSPTLFSYQPEQNVESTSILYVGRIVKEKGIHILIESFNELKKEVPNLQLYIVGDINTKSDYITDLITHTSNNIHFLGQIDRKTGLPELYRKATVLCLPTIIKEALPTVVIEAALSGTSIVSSNHAGSIEACDGNGYFCNPNDTDALKNALAAAIHNIDERNEKVKNAYTFASSNFKWETIVQKFESNLLDVLK